MVGDATRFRLAALADQSPWRILPTVSLADLLGLSSWMTGCCSV